MLSVTLKNYKLLPGQVKFDFSQYEKAEDIVILDKEAYLYGKFYEVGTLDIEMYYKLQQRCLMIRLHSANIFPSDESPGKNTASPIDWWETRTSLMVI